MLAGTVCFTAEPMNYILYADWCISLLCYHIHFYPLQPLFCKTPFSHTIKMMGFLLYFAQLIFFNDSYLAR